MVNKIRAVRQSQGLTQTELAAGIGVKQPHISRIECGVKSPTLCQLMKIAELLNVDAAQLLPDIETTEQSL